MFGRLPKVPVTPEQQEWIEKSFHLLVELFGNEWVRTRPLVLPNEQFFPRQWEGTEDWARYAFDQICAFMQIERGRVELKFVEDPWIHIRGSGFGLGPTRGAAGTYREIADEAGATIAQISVRDSLVIHEPEVMVAVMAHELAHVLLLGGKKISRAMEKMEPLTDLMTVFCGFGVLNANAAHIHRSGPGGWRQSRHGYLSQREFGYALAVFSWERGETDPVWAVELTKNVRVFMRMTLAHFKSTKRPVNA